MSRKCSVSGKKAQSGNNVSHANNKRRKAWQPNLHSKRVFDPESGRWIHLRVSSRVLRSFSKNGVAETLKSYGLSPLSFRK